MKTDETLTLVLDGKIGIPLCRDNIEEVRSWLLTLLHPTRVLPSGTLCVVGDTTPRGESRMGWLFIEQEGDHIMIRPQGADNTVHLKQETCPVGDLPEIAVICGGGLVRSIWVRKEGFDPAIAACQVYDYDDDDFMRAKPEEGLPDGDELLAALQQSHVEIW